MKDARRLLCGKLFDMDFRKLHNSVYISPYDCREIIERVSDFFKIKKYISLFETDYFDRQKEFIKIFKLK